MSLSLDRSPIRARLDRQHRVQSAVGPSHGVSKWLNEVLGTLGIDCAHRYRSAPVLDIDIDIDIVLRH
jgi:hypothetical protein